MAKITIQNEEGQYLNRYKMTPVDDQPNTYDLERAANITKQGTPFGPDTMEHYVQTEDLEAHTTDTTAHITAAERTTWNAAVPSTRKINNKALSADVTLAAADVGAVPTSDVATGAAANKILRMNSSGQLPATSTDTTSVASALTISTAAPTSTLAAGKLWGVY